jgi:hypothetical protein
MKVAIVPTSKLAINSFVSMGMPCVDGIPRSSPHSSIAYHPATTKRSQLAVVPAVSRAAPSSTLFRWASTRGPAGAAASGPGGWFERVLFYSPSAVASAVVAILASAGLETDYHPRIARGWRRRSQKHPSGQPCPDHLAMSATRRLSTDCPPPPINFRKQLSTCISPNGL